MKLVISVCLAVAAMAFPNTGSFSKVDGFKEFRIPRMSNDIIPNIIGGKEAIPHSSPYQISIQFHTVGSWNHQCGGVIIEESKILTAAHCILGAEEYLDSFRVAAGEHDLSLPEGTEQFVAIANMSYHQLYSTSTGDFDYGVIYLTQPLIFNQNVAPIALPTAGYVPSGDCVNTGWGNTRTDGTVLKPYKLQEVIIPYVPREECTVLLADNPMSRNITERMICAGDEGKGPCGGDSGGPLVCNNVLAGIVSWGGQPCAKKDFPGVFANIAPALDWIKNNLHSY